MQVTPEYPDVMRPRYLAVKDLPLTTVDSVSPIPLYHQIELDLREMILSGTLAPNDMLPPELELCRAYDVGRHTMRHALTRLAADGLIERHVGRGTFVKSQMDRKQFYLDRSFTKQMAQMGLVARSEVLSTRKGTISEIHPKPLHSKLGYNCFQLERLRFGGDDPIGVQRAVIVTERCPDIDKHNFEECSLYETLASIYDLSIHRILHSISAASATPSQSKLLEIHEGAALLVVNTSAFLRDDDIIEQTTSYYRADRYEYITAHTFH